MNIAHCIFIAAFAASTHRVALPPEPEVRSPQDGEAIGNRYCAADQPCCKIRATGWAPAGRAPFFAVAPLNAGSRIFIQPPIGKPTKNGTFSGLVYLGELHKGAGEWFKIYVFSCASANHFTEGEVLTELPGDCEVSDPVDVHRER